MKIINVDVDNTIQLISLHDTDTNVTESINTKLALPTGNINTILLKFNFIKPIADQDGLHLFAIFNGKRLENGILAEIEGVNWEGEFYPNSCFVPAEVLEKRGEITLGIYGYILNDDESVKKRLSLVPITIGVVTGSYDEKATEGATPESDVFEVYFDDVQKANDLLNEKLMLYKKAEFTYTLNASEKEISIKEDIADFSKLFNLLVYKNSLALVEGVDYSIDYDYKKITLTNAVETDNTEIHLIAFVSTVVNIDDFDIIKNGANLNNLVKGLQEEVERLKDDIEAISIAGSSER